MCRARSSGDVSRLLYYLLVQLWLGNLVAGFVKPCSHVFLLAPSWCYYADVLAVMGPSGAGKVCLSPLSTSDVATMMFLRPALLWALYHFRNPSIVLCLTPCSHLAYIVLRVCACFDFFAFACC